MVSEVPVALSGEKVMTDTDHTTGSLGKLENETPEDPKGATPSNLSHEHGNLHELKHSTVDEHSLGNAREKSKTVKNLVESHLEDHKANAEVS